MLTSAPPAPTSRTDDGTSGAVAEPGASLPRTFDVTAVLNGVVAVSFAAVGVTGVTVIVIVDRAVAPLVSVTR